MMIDSATGATEQVDGLGYLRRRVIEEADAAVRASSVQATLIHVALATAYAKRFGEGGSAAARSWVDQHRVW